MTVFPANHVNIFYMGLCVNSGSHIKYTYMINPGAQLYGTPEPCKYFSVEVTCFATNRLPCTLKL